MTSDVAAGVPLAVQQIQRLAASNGLGTKISRSTLGLSRVMASPFLDLRYLFGW